MTPDDTITPEFRYYYYQLVSHIARATAAAGGSMITPLPDPFWCSVLAAVRDGKGTGLDPAVQAGQWNWGSDFGLKVERTPGAAPKVVVSGKFPWLGQPLQDLSEFQQVSQAFGRRVVISAGRSAKGRIPAIIWRWTIDFYPGKPPLLSSLEQNGTKRAIMEWLDRGAPTQGPSPPPPAPIPDQ
jgi:hypothetical protein